jgi:hypothetical protein
MVLAAEGISPAGRGRGVAQRLGGLRPTVLGRGGRGVVVLAPVRIITSVLLCEAEGQRPTSRGFRGRQTC